MEAERPAGAVETQVGAHRALFLPPDIIRVWWCGVSRQPELNDLFDFAERSVGARRFFVIADFSLATQIEPAARKAASLDPRTKQIAGLAMLGTTFHVRILMTMMQKALEIVSKIPPGLIRFCNSENEAFTWIENERKRLGL